jgi:hypothetical protein
MNVMGPIRIRRMLRGSRRRLAVIAALIALGSIVSMHHAGPTMGGMDQGVGAEMVVCLAVVTAVGAAVVAVAMGVLRWRPPRTNVALGLIASSIPAAPPPWWARAGPVSLQVLRR